MASTIVRGTCELCGDVDMTPDQIRLRVCTVPELSTYQFNCPSCSQLVIKPAADPRIITLLGSVGVSPVYWSPPAELDEVHDGPPLTSDDLIDLMLLLDRPDWADRLSVSAR